MRLRSEFKNCLLRSHSICITSKWEVKNEGDYLDVGRREVVGPQRWALDGSFEYKNFAENGHDDCTVSYGSAHLKKKFKSQNGL